MPRDALLPGFSTNWQTTYSNYKSPVGSSLYPMVPQKCCRVISLSYGSTRSFGYLSILWFRQKSCRVIFLTFRVAESPLGWFLYHMVPPKVLSGYFSSLWFRQKSYRVIYLSYGSAKSPVGSFFYPMVPPKALWVIILYYGSARSPFGSFLYPTEWFRQKSCRVIFLSYVSAKSCVRSFFYPFRHKSCRAISLSNGSAKSPLGSFLYPMVLLPHRLSPSIIYIPPKNINYLANDLHPDA